MTRGIARLIRARLHPLHHARRMPFVRATLAGADFAVWAKLAGIAWPVRVRVVRHASYVIRSATPEREMAALALAIVDVFDIQRFCDVGANFGYYAWLLKSRSPSLKVDLVEPEPENLKLIDATLARTPLRGVSVHRLAASDTEGFSPFLRDVSSGATGTLEMPGGVQLVGHVPAEVPTSPLDDLLAEGAGLIKIDVEGHEERVLDGARALLARDAPFLLFECFHRDHAAPGMLEALGYELFDADRFGKPNNLTMNYLGVPRRARNRVPELHDAWRDRVHG